MIGLKRTGTCVLGSQRGVVGFVFTKPQKTCPIGTKPNVGILSSLGLSTTCSRTEQPTITPSVTNCPRNYVADPSWSTGGMCVMQVRGQIMNGMNIQVTPTCPNGKKQADATGNASTTQVCATCPAGSTYTTVAVKHRTKNLVLTNYVCTFPTSVPVQSCPDGFTPNGDYCSTEAVCPDGFIESGTRCIFKI